MPVKIKKLPSGKYQVRTPFGIKAKGTTKKKAHIQKWIIEKEAKER